MKKSNAPHARQRILDAAVAVFSEKGFDGARVDQISQKASVPKSLIYYHFKSKDEILSVLMEDFINEYEFLIRQPMENGPVDYSPESLGRRIQDNYSAFIEKNADLLRIAFIESLKKTTEKPYVFRIAEMIVRQDDIDPEANSFSERMMGEFFTGIVPILAFVCFQPAWEKSYSLSPDDMKHIFADLLSVSHGAYHRELLKDEDSDENKGE